MTTEQTFHLYTPDRFLEYASKTEKVNQETIDEVREIRTEKYSQFVNINNLAPGFTTSAIENIFKTNQVINQMNSFGDISKSFQVSNTLNEIMKNKEFVKNLDSFKTMGAMSKILGNSSAISEIIKNNEFFKTLSSVKEFADLQKTFNAIENQPATYPLTDAYMASKKIEKEQLGGTTDHENSQVDE